jgi:predicted TIM-barrel fold metal-dependent hydrolase
MIPISYPIIDADAHVNEPPDLWQTRVEARLRERAPKVVKGPDGHDRWSFDNGQRLMPIGRTVVAGLSFLDYRVDGFSYDTIRPSSFDPQARLEDLALDGLAAQVLYPSVALGGAKTYSADPGMQLACIRAYNDWLADFCSHAPDRLHGVAILPATGVDDLLAELDFAVRRGLKAAMLSAFPGGSLEPNPELDDRGWAAIQESGLPAAIHIGSFTKRAFSMGAFPAQELSLTASSKSGGLAMELTGDIIFSGIPERFPNLKFLLVESNIGWIPPWLEQMDDNYMRHRFWSGAHQLPLTPSEYWLRQFYATFMVDRSGVETRHRVGVDHIMWSTDFPHAGSDWPNSRWVIAHNFDGVPADETRKMLHDNAAVLFRVPL